MRLLMIGDVVGAPGCNYVREKLPAFKRKYEIDVVVANGENSAVGNGVLPVSAGHLFDSGIDVLTGGNHSFKRREIYDYLPDHPNLLRPANYPDCPYGEGWFVLDAGSFTLLVISLLGTVYLEPLDDPFRTADKLIREHPATFTVVDFHAEATGEKMAMGYYLDGRVSAVVGTHTHVQTADEQILEKGTGYISDLGMTGPVRSILGTSPEDIVQKMTSHLPTRFHVPEGACKLEGVILDLDKKTGLCTEIRRVRI
ncbi:MAG: TIGR00282 family metallophosphoesterase [Candidatus Faecivivens sp.]|nr:TIGR00282 family metallophosphoesterase [Oscillospiraceae bacterium]MDY2713641.1 TIGR00282 family metallophosphoesterase [Candidatus Faecivivens sp.]